MTSGDGNSGNGEQETKAHRFNRLAEQRAAMAIRRIRMVGQCSNRATYEYNEDQVTMLFNALHHEVNEARARFDVHAGREVKPIGLAEAAGEIVFA